MVAIRLSAVIGEDRQLVVKLPDDTPIGAVELEIHLLNSPVHEEREEMRARLLAAGLLVRPEDMDIPDDLEYISDEALEELVRLPSNSPSTDQLIDQDRGMT